MRRLLAIIVLFVSPFSGVSPPWRSTASTKRLLPSNRAWGTGRQSHRHGAQGLRGKRLTATLLACFMLATGCDRGAALPKSPFKGIDVTGSTMGQELRLADHDGKPRSLGDFRGKVVVVTFGFMHCPDVCPTTLAAYAAAVKSLGTDGAAVQVLFVTVDPERDSPELLRQFVPAFHPAFIGLWGDAQAIGNVTRDFKIYFQKRPGKTPTSYTVDHSTQSFVFDREGRPRLVIPHGTAPGAIASDLRILLNS